MLCFILASHNSLNLHSEPDECLKMVAWDHSYVGLKYCSDHKLDPIGHKHLAVASNGVVMLFCATTV